MRRTALWILAAVAGVLVVAGVTAAASTLSTQTIGLSSEPLTAGDELAPRTTATPTATSRKADDRRKQKRDDHPAASTGRGSSGTSTPSGGDDHGGSGS